MKMWSRQQGFTLVELIVSIVVVGVIAGGVAVTINESDTNAKAANAAHAILTDLRYTQELAMSNRREARFIIGAGDFGGAYIALWADNFQIIRRSTVEGSEQIFTYFTNNDDFKGLSYSTGNANDITFRTTGEPEIRGVLFAEGVDQTVVTINGSKTIKLTPGTGYTYFDES